METFEEFKFKLQHKEKKPRKTCPTQAVGIRQAYLFLQKRKWKDVGQPIKESDFQKIVRRVNAEMGSLLVERHTITLPARMGKVEVRVWNNGARYNKNGELVLPKVIDWNATLKLWYEDKEAYEQKLLVRDRGKNAVKVFYNRHSALYNNKGFYDFKINREIVRTLSSMLREGTLEVFKYGTIRKN